MKPLSNLGLNSALGISTKLASQSPRQENSASCEPSDGFLPTGQVAKPHPKPNFAPSITIDQVAASLEKDWSVRMGGQQRCTVGVIVERDWRPTEEHDEVLDICDAVMDAGGIPKLLYLGNGSVNNQMAGLHGLAVPGGRDIDPSKYGAKLGPAMDPAEPDPAFDDFEIAAIRQAYDTDLPLLGHCRGTQLMNVAGGGTLTQDIPSEFLTSDGWGSKYANKVDHRPEETRHDYASRLNPVHFLVIEPGSNLEKLVGQLDSVNSIHHQCIAAISPLLYPVAFALDGLVEGVQRKGKDWQSGYQFHPEALRYSDSRYQGIYDKLVNDGEKFKQGRLLSAKP